MEQPIIHVISIVIMGIGRHVVACAWRPEPDVVGMMAKHAQEEDQHHQEHGHHTSDGNPNNDCHVGSSSAAAAGGRATVAAIAHRVTVGTGGRRRRHAILRGQEHVHREEHWLQLAHAGGGVGGPNLNIPRHAPSAVEAREDGAGGVDTRRRAPQRRRDGGGVGTGHHKVDEDRAALLQQEAAAVGPNALWLLARAEDPPGVRVLSCCKQGIVV